MRNAYFVEHGPFRPESQPLVEAYGIGLCVKVYLRQGQFCGLVHEMDNDGGANAPAAVARQDCDSTDLAGGCEPPGPGQVAGSGIRECVTAGWVHIVNFLGFRDALLLDEHPAPHGHQLLLVVLPGRRKHPDRLCGRAVRHCVRGWRQGRCTWRA